MRPFPTVRSLQIASIGKPVRPLQAIAAFTKRSPQAAIRIRPAHAILPNSIVPLAVSLWQPRISAAPMAIAPPDSISVQRATRFQTGREAAAGCSSSKQPSKGNIFQVCLRDRIVAESSSHAQAAATAARLRQWLKTNPSADNLKLQIVDERPAIVSGDDMLIAIDSRLGRAIRLNRELIAIDWLNQLRLALDAEPLELADAQMQLYGLSGEHQGEISGIASWYGPYFHGRITATGEVYNQYALTAAHPSLPFDTFLKVTNLETGKSVIVRINDRGPYVGTRSLDLSRQAARSIGSEERGIVNYEAVILDPPPAIAQDRPSPDAVAFSNTK